MAGISSLCFLLALAACPVVLLAQDAEDAAELVLLMTERGSFWTPGLIYRVNLHHKNYTRLSLKGLSYPAAIDYDNVKKRVYWTDINMENIRSADLDGGNDTIIASLNNVSYPRGLAVDAEAEKIFYTDMGNQVVVKIDIVSLNITTIVKTELDAPWGIAVDKMKQMLYWVDHGHDTGGDRIESCDYYGNQRRNVTEDEIYAATGLALNAATERLYWCQYNGEVVTIRTDGTDRRELIARRSPIRRFMDIALYNGNLYITDITNSRIIVLPESGGETASLSSRYFGNLIGVHVFSPTIPETGCQDGQYGVGCTQTCGKCREGIICEKTVGVCLGGCAIGYEGTKCDQVCAEGSYGYRCSSVCGYCKEGTTCNHLTGVCPSGCRDTWVGVKCKDKEDGPDLVILMTERHYFSRLGRLYKLFIHHMNFTLLTRRNIVTPTSIDYDEVNKHVYWTDISTEQIRRSDLHGDNDTEVAKLNNISYAEGIAVDGAAGKLFYTDRGNKVIVSIIMIDFSSTTIVDSDLDTPWGITADKKNKMLYWVDRGSDKIETCDYNGRNRKAVLSQGLYSPTGIAINVKTNRLYWSEYYGKVKSIKTDGTGNKTLISTSRVPRLFMDISLYNGFLYMADPRNSNITVIPEEGGTEMRLSASAFGKLNGIHVFSPNTNDETGCSHGKYGVGCTESCGHCKLDTTCEKTVGVCLAGCGPGYLGEMCTDMCVSGTYGDKCANQCGHCAEGTTCNVETGNCPSGCEKGWIGQTCQNEECKPGTYGHLLCLPCGQCKNNSACNTDNGVCPGACDAGWKGSNCQTPCPPGTYGDACSLSCGYCSRGAVCNRMTGSCPYGCDLGYTGSTCKTKRDCLLGTYGRLCHPCGSCKAGQHCDKASGRCPNGCHDNWIGVRCNIRGNRCPKGKYGASCQAFCGHCKGNDTCHPFTGTCPNGCKAGYKGSICKVGCLFMYYGENCGKECGYCNNSDTCDPMTGDCPNGCKSEFTDSKCQTKGPKASAKTSAAVGLRKRYFDFLGFSTLLIITFYIIL